MQVTVNVTPNKLVEIAAPTPQQFADQLRADNGNFFGELDNGSRGVLIAAVVKCMQRNINAGVFKL